MTVGLVGRKCGMTRVFTEAGESIPVTVVEVIPNHVTQVKTREIDGYRAVKVAVGSKKLSHVTKSMAGEFKKAGIEAAELMREFRLAEQELQDIKVGDQLTVDLFKEGQTIDVIATSKGKGFAGVVKRHNFRTQDASHGNSLSHRAPGSIGQCQTPGRVFKGKKMAGHMGDVRTTVQNQMVVKVDAERQLILVKGTIPGAPGGKVVIMPAIKRTGDK